jgi:hypothetical protein
MLSPDKFFRVSAWPGQTPARDKCNTFRDNIIQRATIERQPLRKFLLCPYYVLGQRGRKCVHRCRRFECAPNPSIPTRSVEAALGCYFSLLQHGFSWLGSNKHLVNADRPRPRNREEHQRRAYQGHIALEVMQLNNAVQPL